MFRAAGTKAGERRSRPPVALPPRSRLRRAAALLLLAAAAGAVLVADPVSAYAVSRSAIHADAQGFLDPLTSRPPTPDRIRIPAIDVNAPVVRLGLARDRSLEVPTNAFAAGWFTGGPAPGQLGPAIVAAHVHWNGRPGAFAKLGDLRYDDRIVIMRSDGSSAVFRVTRVSRFAKSHFPTELVYGNVDHRGLRLITCDGFDVSRRAYLDNVVVFAMLVKVLPRPAGAGARA